jgi:hypothetical protein
MSIVNGPICSTSASYGDATSSSYGWYVTTLGDTIKIAKPRTPGSSDTGLQGEICWDASYIYVCVADNTWKRAALVGGY